MDENKINEIRRSVNIVDYISKFIPLTQRGKNYFGVCPFHNDHSPSMSVSLDKQIYTCFSCGATGNIFKFVCDYENVSFLEGVAIVAREAGIDVNISTNSKVDNINKDLYDIYDIACKFYQNNINTTYGSGAIDYLNKRDISSDIINEFGIGLSLKKRDLLYDILVKKGISNKIILDSGLVVKNEYGYGDIYHNRIMFPLHDINGRVVGFSGRVYDEDNSSKYINSRESEIFKKGEMLYNYYRAHNECRLNNTVIIMEGFMDVIRAYSVGILNVVATMGTAITKNHVNLIKKLGKNVILCFDGDRAGLKATVTCLDMLLDNGVSPKIVRLKDDLDPDEFIKLYGRDAFLSQIDNAYSAIDFKINYFKDGKDLHSSVDAASYIKQVLAELNKIDDDILREVTIKKISHEMNIDIDFLTGHVVVNKKKNIPRRIDYLKNMNKYKKAQVALIYYMLKSDEVIQIYDKKITFMPDDIYRKLARDISVFRSDNGEFSVADYLTHIGDNQEFLKEIELILNLNLNDEFEFAEIDDYIFTIKDYNIKNEIERLKSEMRVEVDAIKKAKIGQRIIELKLLEER